MVSLFSELEVICVYLKSISFEFMFSLLFPLTVDYFVLSGKGRTNTTSIQLLTTVTAHGSLTTRLLFTNISFVREDVDALYNEKAVARLRQPFIKFLLSMIEHASPPVLKAIIDEKGWDIVFNLHFVMHLLPSVCFELLKYYVLQVLNLILSLYRI